MASDLNLLNSQSVSSLLNNKGNLNSNHNSSELEKLSKEDEFNSDRVDEIHKCFEMIYQALPSDPYSIITVDISRLIEEYEYMDKPLNDLYSKVMNKLEVSKERRKSLDFENDNFALQLYSLVSTGEIGSFPKNDLFWCDLSRLLFKWMIYMKQETMENDKKFKEILKTIKLFAFKINERSNMIIPIGFDLGFMSLASRDRFKELMKSEFFEHAYIFHHLASIIKYFYENKGKGERQEKGNGKKIVTCKDLKNKYFNGNYDSNILLKYLIIRYDPDGKMRKCIINDDYHADYLNVSLSIKVTSYYLEELDHGGPKDLENIDMIYVSSSMINFFLSNNRRFWIIFSNNLINLLRRLKRENLLTREMIEKLVGFRLFYNDPLEWNQTTFKKFINMHKDYYPSTLEIKRLEYDEYLKLINST